MSLETAKRVLKIEAQAIQDVLSRLDATFEKAVDLLFACKGRVVLTGMGKSGLVARKISATFSSTGTPSFFLHPGEALHGDLGMLARGDVVIALSASGETEEILRLLANIKRIGDALISFCCNTVSTLALSSDICLDVSVPEEACGMGLAPTASTTAMLALGDALAIAVSLKKGFRAEDFADLHPGGKLGKRLSRVRDLMHAGEAVPRVTMTTPMTDVIYEMSRKKLGMTTVEVNGRLIGIISDGDLRRLLERDGPEALKKTAGDAMNPHPRTIAAEELAVRALSMMEEQKITSLVAIDSSGTIEGVVHLHDLWETELI